MLGCCDKLTTHVDRVVFYLGCFVVDGWWAFLKSFDGKIIFFSAFLVLCNYYYFYFVDFYQGVAGGGWVFSALKFFGIFLVAASLLRISPRVDEKELWCVAFFFISALTIFFLKGILLGFDDGMFLNTFLCLIPFLVLRLRRGRETVVFFFECCLFILIFQIFLDQIIYWAGSSLWENQAFVGGVGNPSSFGLLCNLLLCYVLFERRATFSSALFAFVLAYGVCRSNSLLALISLVLVLGFYFFERRSWSRFAYVLAVFSFSVYLGGQAHLFYKIDSLAGLALEGDVGGSASVSTRLHIHYEFLDNLLSNPLDALFYGFTNKAYMAYDSQFLTYFSSFGLLFSLLFFLSFFLVLLRCLFGGVDYFVFVALLIFSLTFLPNRILDYYPIPIFFALLVVLASERCSCKGRLFPLGQRSLSFCSTKSERLSS